MSSEQEVLQALDYKRHNIEGYEVEGECVCVCVCV